MNTTHIHWLGHDAFRIEDAGKQIYIDPWKLKTTTQNADYILVTHNHYDHFSQEDISKITKATTKIFGPADVARQVGKNAVAMHPNEEQIIDKIKIQTVPAYNIGKPFHPKEKDWVGFIITLSDGTTIYHAGDTDFIPEMTSLQVDIALLPVSGTYVMTAEEAIEAAHAFTPKIVIPMHFGEIVGTQNDAERFKTGFSGVTEIKAIAE